jgi:hypothetical protein
LIPAAKRKHNVVVVRLYDLVYHLVYFEIPYILRELECFPLVINSDGGDCVLREMFSQFNAGLCDPA